MTEDAALDTYIIKGGETGKARMSVIASVLAPATASLLDRFEPLAGLRVIDAGCGGGELSFELARRVGPEGHVLGIDLDDTKLTLARAEAAAHGLANLEFRQASVLDPWPAAGVSLVLVRFVLTHLTSPQTLLAQAQAALKPGGALAVEDIDYSGHFCDPPSAAVDRYRELYTAVAQRRGGDPYIGLRLVRLLEDAGFANVDAALAQPFGRSGDVKRIASLTLAGISDTLVATALATSEEIERVADDLAAFVARPDTTLSLPRIFQAWGRKRAA